MLAGFDTAYCDKGSDRPRRAWGRSRRSDFGRGGPQTGRAFTLL